MPLDHYVSQVHLRNFYSPVLGGKQMFGTRKSDLLTFPCTSESVCRTADGSTNEYLQEPRAIEEFLTAVEPRYNAALEKLRTGAIDTECVFVFSGFAAYVAICSPAAMRIHSGPLRSEVEVTANILDAQNILPRAPEQLGGLTLSELLRNGKVTVDIDGKYPQAMGIASIMDRVVVWGNSSWDVLINEDRSSPFFTSDFPVAIEPSSDPRVLNRIVPVSPEIAIRIKPDLYIDKARADLSFKAFNVRYCRLSTAEIRAVNTAIVRCAETLVFYRDQLEWVSPFVKKHRQFRIEPHTAKIPHGNGSMLWTAMRVEASS